MPSWMRLVSFALCSLSACGAPFQQNEVMRPQIVQPGAPGQPSKNLFPSEVRIAVCPPTQADVDFMQAMTVSHSQQ